MGMCKDDTIDGSWIHRKVTPVALLPKARALKQTTVYQGLDPVLFHQKTGSGDSLGCSEKTDFH